MKSLKIGSLQLNSNIGLAPLAGVSDVAFREICKIYGAGITFTEMVSAKGLHYKSEKTKDLLKLSPLETLSGVQLFGSDADIIASIILQVEKDFSIIDINMGCPAPKIIRNGEGGALLKKENWKLAQDIMTKAVKTTKLPVTIKMRAGYSSDTACDFAKMAEDCGISAVSIHPRFVKQLYTGKADWSVTAKVKKTVSIPVIARGNIFSASDYFNCIEQTNADGVYIARGSFGNPFIFRQIADSSFKVSLKELIDLIHKHIQLSNSYMGERYTVVSMRKHLLWYLTEHKHLLGKNAIKDVRSSINVIDTIEKLVELINLLHG